ncbi:MAG: hypothetical protein V7605_959, partial [Acidimicrobiaceae bacterium]
DEFLGGSTPPPLTTLDEFRGHRLGPADLPALANLYRDHVAATQGDVYLFLSADQDLYSEVLGLLPKGSIAGLDRALAASPDWRVFYRDRDAVIYRFLGATQPAATGSVLPAQQPPQDCSGGNCGASGGGDSRQGIVQGQPGELGPPPAAGDGAVPAP